MTTNKARYLQKQFGFTLLEMLLGIAILGILGGAALRTYFLETNRSQVRALQQQIIADLQDARSKAQRFSTQRTVRIVNATQYQVLNGGTVIQTRNTPSNLRMLIRTSSTAGTQAVPSNFNFRYMPPFGLFDTGSAATIEVGRATATPTTLTDSVFIKVIGVTGKVISSATF
jgi:prepilin-type N-terminal cleavage/methylation domain-containing protein